MTLEDQVNATEDTPRAVLLRALERVDRGDVTDVVVIEESAAGTSWQTSRPISYATSLGMAMLCQDGLRQQAREDARDNEEEGV